MIKFIKSVKDDIAKKDVYVWNVNVDSMNLFVSLGIMLIDIKGFVLPQGNNLKGDNTIMNRPLVTIEEFNQKFNAVLITADYCVTIKEAEHLINKPIFKFTEILSINQSLYNKNIYLYGIGQGAKEISENLFKENIKVRGYVVTQTYRGGVYT